MTAQDFDHEQRAAIQDVLVTTKSIKVRDDGAIKALLHRIVAMRPRMAMKCDGVAEASKAYHSDVEHDYEHRFAEHEHEHERDTKNENTPEPWDATERRWRCFS